MISLSLNGLTVTGGKTGTTYYYNGGGGIWADQNVKLAMNNCKVTGNTFVNQTGQSYEQGGGGLAVTHYSTLQMDNCEITNNQVYALQYDGKTVLRGGGVFTASHSDARITRTVISGNKLTTPNAESDPTAYGSYKALGGGIYNNGDLAIYRYCTVTDNVVRGAVADNNGAGVYNAAKSNPRDSVNTWAFRIDNSTIKGNVAGDSVGEMNRRYELFAQKSRAGTHVVNIDEYNASLEADEEKLPKIVIVIDELADLMLSAKKDVEERIQNLTQKSRAAGIHMVIATQRPSVNVITGVIKANLPTRIAFMVATDTDSRVILDVTGAQRLLGNGDMLYSMSGKAPIRVQNAYSDSAENQKVVDFIRENNDAYYDEEASMYINNSRPSDGDGFDFSGGEVEQVYIDALRLVMQSGSASISMVQRKCFVGYSKAGKIIEWMEAMGYISPFDGAKSRKVLITKEVFESNYGPF